MYDGELYNRSNALQRRDAQLILDKYFPVLVERHLKQKKLSKQKRNRKSNVLDIGCGCGKVTVEILYPKLVSYLRSLTAIDVSQNMIHFAQNQYNQTSKVEFRVFDISDLKVPENMQHKYHEIFSFYCLHWIQDQRIAFENIFKMLINKGLFMASFMAQNPIFDIYLKMSKNEKWSQYMSDVQSFISPYHRLENPLMDIVCNLNSAGFTVDFCSVERMQFAYDSVEALKNSVKAVNPFLVRIPEHLHDNFLNDYVSEVQKLNFFIENQIIFSYKSIVVICTK